MSKTLVLEMPDEVFAAVEKSAARQAASTENFILELILRNFPKQPETAGAEAARIAEERFARWIGAVSSGNPHSADNEQIDADLAREYGATHDDK